MDYRKLGQTGLEVSAVGLGGHLFPPQATEYYEGHYGRRIVEAEALRLRRCVVEAAVECGINLVAADFDFEMAALGRIIKDLDLRHRLAITTVMNFRPQPGKPVDWSQMESDLDRALGLLAVDRIELPQYRLTGEYLESDLLAEMSDRLKRIRNKGKIVEPLFYTGDNDRCALAEGLSLGLVQASASALGILNPGAADEVLPAVSKAQAGFIGFVPFQKGLLFDCGREAGMTDQEICETGLGWCLAQDGVTSILCGAAGPDEVRANAAGAVYKPDPGQLELAIARLSQTKAYDRFIERAPKQWRD